MPNPIPPPPPEQHTPAPAHSAPAPIAAPSPHGSQTGFFARLFVMIVVVIIIVAGGIFLIARHKKTTPNNPALSVTQIRQIFQPPVATTTTRQLPALVVTSTSTPYSSSAPTTTPQNQLYTNAALGFQMPLPQPWQVKAYSNSEIILADQNGPQLTIQSINNAQTSLNAIRTQLEGSSTVRDLINTTFQNQPALSFNTTSSQQGLAVIYNNNLYYIIGHLKAAPLAGFRFL